MSQPQRWSVSWHTTAGELETREPSRAEVEVIASSLSAWYNEEYNRAMMSNQHEMGPADVREHFDNLWAKGGRAFLLYAQGHLMGDADLRHIDHRAGTAEFAIMIGERNVQGRGYGTRFALMLHALAFEKLALERIYVSIIPANRGSQRLFEKLGYQLDVSPAARAYTDEDDDITMSFGRDDFRRLHAENSGHLSMTLLPDRRATPAR
jgi:RimJ/RimL family protein N-acetyltransferase